MSSITLSVRQERDKVALGRKHIQHLLVSLEGSKIPQASRKPLRIGVAIDCSGSMSGEKLQYAKKSLTKLVEHLSEEDVLGVVGFSDNIFKVVEPQKMTAAAKAAAIQEISKLHDLGSTNLSGATIEAYNYLKNGLEAGMKGSLGRAFLFTDGLPTAGETNSQSLVRIAGEKRPEGDSLSCFGYGKDHDPELLASMAKAGGGNFYFVQTPDQAPAFFGRELGGLLSCVAQGVKVTVKTKPDVKIQEVLNDLDVKGNTNDTEVVVTVDDVYAGEKRNVLLRLELPEMDKGGHPFKYADVKVEFEDLVAKKTEVLEATIKVEYVKEEEAQKDADKDVQDQIALQQAAKAQEEARKFADQGNFAQAKGVLRNAVMVCMSLKSQLGSKMAHDLEANVEPYMEAERYAQGGAAYLHSNSKGYTHGRASNVGTSAMFETEEQKLMASEFTADDTVPHNGPIPLPPGASTHAPFMKNAPKIGPAVGPQEKPKKTVTKNRRQR
jgi:Ca-activated chloride channel family protein